MSNRRTFFQYVIPSVLSFALSGVYAIVDGFFCRQTPIGDARAFRDKLAYPVTAVLQAVGTGLGMGGAVRYSILKAEGNEEKAREYIAAATWLMLLFSAALTGAVFFASKSILSALGASGELLTLGDEYIRVIALGAVLQIFGTGLDSVYAQLRRLGVGNDRHDLRLCREHRPRLCLRVGSQSGNVRARLWRRLSGRASRWR